MACVRDREREREREKEESVSVYVIARSVRESGLKDREGMDERERETFSTFLSKNSFMKWLYLPFSKALS